MLHKWMKLQKDMECISMVTIPRFIGNSNCQLLCFCDASTKAYASVIYLSSDAGVNLLFSKARVAPIKKLGTPRLELLAVLIGVRMLNFVQQQLQPPTEKKFLWTDNQCVVHWIMSKKPLTTFVQNRVKEITETKDISFGYVESSQNPADLAARGVSAQDLDKCELGGMDRNGFRTVRKHGQLGISQWLLKKRWRRLKGIQRARKPSMKPPTWLEKISMKGRLTQR